MCFYICAPSFLPPPYHHHTPSSAAEASNDAVGDPGAVVVSLTAASTSIGIVVEQSDVHASDNVGVGTTVELMTGPLGVLSNTSLSLTDVTVADTVAGASGIMSNIGIGVSVLVSFFARVTDLAVSLNRIAATRNAAVRYGGGVSVILGGNGGATIENTSIALADVVAVNNSASLGGGVGVVVGSLAVSHAPLRNVTSLAANATLSNVSVVVDGVVASGNVASACGGGLGILFGDTITDVSAVEGFTVIVPTSITITNSTFVNNAVSTWGSPCRVPMPLACFSGPRKIFLYLSVSRERLSALL